MSVAYRITEVPGLFSEGLDSASGSASLRARAMREALLGETVRQRCDRLARVALAMASPRRLLGLLVYLELMARDKAVGAAALPDPKDAASRPQGFCGAASDISPSTLMQGYAQGLHARAPFGAASWWSPRRRRLIDLGGPSQAPVSRACFDTQSDRTVARCAQAALRRAPLTTLSPALRRAHARLLDRGYAHSWSVEGAEGYGVVIGSIFIVLGLAGEPPAAALALRALEQELRRRRFCVLDVTVVADALEGEVGTQVERSDYLDMLANSPSCDAAVRWR